MDTNFELMRSLAPDASDEMIIGKIAALKKHPNNLDAAVGALFDQGDLLESVSGSQYNPHSLLEAQTKLTLGSE
ncbi:6201_t:CDS:2 [Acaulospora colombiana]|uniref:6201_t:CDS:1 n=1 Tax=Acaulospora colombiana TaxID=27376 RepID=A0ACA9Q333_9GLOM|nr:6201_t:CDS:2 [Acaulospora colombiana]